MSQFSDISLEESLMVPQFKQEPLYNLSLFIPRVFVNISWQKIAHIFHSLRIGKVKQIDFVRKRSHDGKPYNAVFVHFEHWYDNTAARNFQAKVRDPSEEARLVYDEPWYWVVLENKCFNKLWEHANDW